MPPVARFRAPEGHLIVCGDDMLAFRVAQELTTRYRERVTAILPSKRQGQGPYIDRLPGARVIERDELTSQAFTDAQITSARALALLRQDDVGNFHAALRARELNPDIRLVVAVFSPGLGEQVRAFFPDCAVLVGTSMSAPSFVAAALGEPAPSHVRVSGRTLFVARPEDADPAQVLCGLAAPSASGGPMLLPRNEQTADLVLAVADGTPRNPLLRKRDPAQAAARILRSLFWHKLGFGFAALFAVLVAGFCLLLAATGYPWTTALYLTMLDAAGAALTNPAAGGAEKVAQVLLTFDGLVFVPFVTALIVGARLTGSIRGRPPAASGHVIVVGLGNVGTLVVAQLHDLGVPVVAIDRDPKVPGVAFARRLGGARGHRRDSPGGDAARGQPGLEHRPGLGDQQRRGQPGGGAARPRAPVRPADRAPAVRRRPGRAGAEDDRQHGLPQRVLPGRAGLRRGHAGAPGAADDSGGTARPAHRRRPGRAGRRAGRAGRSRPPSSPGETHVLAVRRRGTDELRLVAGRQLPDRPAGPPAGPGHPSGPGKDPRPQPAAGHRKRWRRSPARAGCNRRTNEYCGIP